MARKSAKSRKKSTRKRATAKAKAHKSASSKSKVRKSSGKRSKGSKVVAKAKSKSRRPKSKAKKHTAAKVQATKKATRAKSKSRRPRSKAKKHTAAKVQATKKVTKAKSRSRRPRSKAKKHTAAKVQATRKTKRTKSRSVAPKAKRVKGRSRKRKQAHVVAQAKVKRVSRKRRISKPVAQQAPTPRKVASRKARKHAAPKAAPAPKVASRRRRKHAAPKAAPAPKVASRRRRKHAAPKAAPAPKVASRRTAKKTSKATSGKSVTTRRRDFDLNKWLLPTLELEQYDAHITEELGLQDNIKGSTHYAWIGAGQCGGRIVKAFYDLGYKKVLAVNTTRNDLDWLDIPQKQKFLMDIGEEGAGKDMERGTEAVQKYQQEVLHLTRQTFGTQVGHIMVCFGAGGGTGGGSTTGLVEIAKRYARYIGLSNPGKKVGVMMTLPTVGEATSPTVAENAHKIASELSEMASKGKISPLIIIDNEKINKLYPGMTVKSFWPSINSTVAGLFDIFNRVSALSTRYTAFDPVDYHGIMEAGSCAVMGLTRLDKVTDKFAISEAIKANLEKTLLASGFTLSTAKVAGCIVVGSKKLMAQVKGLQENIDYAFDVLSEITGKATIHRGIYEDDKNSLRVYTIIGGLDAPAKRLEELMSCFIVHGK
ncbi:MAG: hypothetical protein ACYS76_03640 [Planctomycetota bacterium]|jgi:histone H1/5